MGRNWISPISLKPGEQTFISLLFLCSFKTIDECYCFLSHSEEILNSSVPVALSLVDERKVVKQHLLGNFRIQIIFSIQLVFSSNRVFFDWFSEDVTSLRVIKLISFGFIFFYLDLFVFSQVEETNGAWRTKAIPDPTLLPQGRTYARYLLLFAFLWYIMLPFGSNEILMSK